MKLERLLDMAALAANEDSDNGKLQEESLQIFRDTTGPLKTQRHVLRRQPV